MVKERGAADNLGRKRQALESLEAAREAPGPAAGSLDGATALSSRLRAAEATVAMLRDEVRQLERQALDAIGEAGRLRRLLDQRPAPAPQDGAAELQQRLVAAEREKALLTGALTESENEIARMTRTLDIVVRKLTLAV